MFTWEYAADPATASVNIGSYKDIKVEKVDSHTVRLSFKKPTPFWADAFCGVRGMIIPKHLFEAFKGAKSREAPTNLKPVGTGPYRFVDFKPGDMVRGELNPNYHMPNRPYFDTIEMKGGGDAVSAARAVIQTGEFDYAWNMQVEDEILKRMEQGGKGKADITPGGNIEHIQLQQHRSVEGSGRRAVERQDQAPVPDRSRRPPGAEPAGRPRRRPGADLRPHRHRHRELPERARRASTPRTRSGSSTSTRPNQVLEAAGWKKGADGIRAKDGVKLKMVYQTSINAPRQKTQAIVKQAAAKAGIEMELKSVTASVYFSSDVANPDTYTHFYTDIQMYTTTMTQPDPELFMHAVHIVGGRLQGQQVAGPEHHALAERGVRQALPRGRERDGPREAGGAVHPDERPRHPERRRDPRRRSGPAVAAVSNRLRVERSGWDSDFWALQNWHARGRRPRAGRVAARPAGLLACPSTSSGAC